MLAPIVAAVMMQVSTGAVPDAVEAAPVSLSEHDGARFGMSLLGAVYGLTIAAGLGGVASLVTLGLSLKSSQGVDPFVIAAAGLIVAGLAVPLSIPLVAHDQHSSERGRGTLGAAVLGSAVGWAAAAALGIGAYLTSDQPVAMGLMIAMAAVTPLLAPAVALELSHWRAVNASFSVAPLRDGAAASLAVRF